MHIKHPVATIIVIDPHIAHDNGYWYILSIVLAIQFVVAKKDRVTIPGWIYTSVSIAIFAAPLSAMLPNVIGLTLEAIQVIIYYYHYSHTSRQTNVEVSVVNDITPENLKG
ncbi:hypothetical protein P8452_38641 [Trifolium repens]|nr:hypothetical protein P8452_38641 [Trifolium repens]